jgi:aconitate hydratase
VVAYALAGSVDVDLASEPLGIDKFGAPVHLRDIWPAPREVREAVAQFVHRGQFEKEYSEVFQGDALWSAMPTPAGDLYEWDERSTYIKKPPYFEELVDPQTSVADFHGMRALAALGVQPRDFNSYGARRGNHEVMMRGTLANIRLRNQLAPGTEGGWTVKLPEGETASIYDAAMRYQQEGVPLMILAGKEYGSGSSRDWAAKGVRLLGVRAVIAESFERIHRSNLVGMGVLPLEFLPEENVKSLGLTGAEVFHMEGVVEAVAGSGRARVRAVAADGAERSFEVKVRVDTPQEAEYYRSGGILPYVLRQLAGAADALSGS